MRAGDKDRLAVIRMLLAAIQRREVDERIELDDAGVLQTIEKLVKQGQESARQYQDGGRQELADKELAEIEVLQSLSAGTARRYGTRRANRARSFAPPAPRSVRDMGKVMGAIREQAQGRADMGVVGGRT